MKILVLRFSSIGDVVLTTPMIRALKTQLEHAEVHYCTKKGYHSILKANPYLDKIHVLEGSLNNLVDELRQENFDIIIDLHHNIRTRIISTRLRVKTYRFSKLNLEKWLMVKFKINRLPRKHIVERYLKTAAPLGVKSDSLGLDYFIPDEDQVELNWLPETHQKKYVIYAIGGQHTTKKLPLSRMIELCDRINWPIILIGGKEDIETGEEILTFFNQKGDPSYEEGLQELGKQAVIFNACGKFNINQSASLIRQARYVFTHDTGMMHIAAAFKKEVFSIWGNTIPEFGMYPYRTKFTIFENNQLGCRPCSKIGFEECPKGHFKCMKEVKFDFYLKD